MEPSAVLPRGAPAVASPDANVTAEPLPIAFLAEGCQGIIAVESYLGFGGPGEHPRGWEPRDGIGSDLYVETYVCERVSVGPFERGPVAFLLESHTRFDSPDACREGADIYRRMVSTFALDDRELAQYVRDVIGMPVVVGTLESASPTVHGEVTYSMAWRLDGSVSRLATEVPASSPLLRNDKDLTVRYYWPHGEGISWLDLHHASHFQNAETRAVRVEFADPLVAAGSTLPVMRGDALFGGTFSGPMVHYGDLACTERL